MWFIGVEVEQETCAPPPKKNPGSAPEHGYNLVCYTEPFLVSSRNVPPQALRNHSKNGCVAD